jgi:hypothetical protein
MDKTIVLIIIIAIACMFSSSIGGAVWYFWDDLVGTPSPSPSTGSSNTQGGPTGTPPTFNGVELDSSGYTVGKGKIWNRSSLQTTGYSKTPSSEWYGKSMTDPDVCRKECIDSSACTHFGWHKDEKKCYLFQSDGDSATDKDYIRGFKNEPGKLYTYGTTDTKLETTTGKSAQQCKNACDSNTACKAWFSKLTGTKDCQLQGSASLNASAVYAEGAVGR